VSVIQNDPTLTPEQRLADLDYSRDALWISVRQNRQAADERRTELLRMIRAKELDPEYDVDADHRIASLLAGAEKWQVEAERVAQQAEALRASLSGRATPRSRAPRNTSTSEAT
jgi:hypothetical protein